MVQRTHPSISEKTIDFLFQEYARLVPPSQQPDEVEIFYLNTTSADTSDQQLALLQSLRIGIYQPFNDSFNGQLDAYSTHIIRPVHPPEGTTQTENQLIVVITSPYEPSWDDWVESAELGTTWIGNLADRASIRRFQRISICQPPDNCPHCHQPYYHDDIAAQIQCPECGKYYFEEPVQRGAELLQFVVSSLQAVGNFLGKLRS